MCVFVMFSTTTSLQFIGQIHSQLKKKKNLLWENPPKGLKPAAKPPNPLL